MKEKGLILLLLFVFSHIQAVEMTGLLAYDDFNETSFGWQGDWVPGDNSNTFSTITHQIPLEYRHSSGILIQGGDHCMRAVASRYGSQSKYLCRDLNGLDETFYVSFLARVAERKTAKWNYIAVGKKDNTDDSGVLLGTVNRKNMLGAVFCENGSKTKYINHFGYSVPDANETYFVVGKWTCNSSGVVTSIKMWLNPTSPYSETAEYSQTTSYSPNDVMSSIDLQAYFGAEAYFDEIRVGRTWQSVVSNIVIEEAPEVKYSGGTGTLDDPYQIASAQDLILLSTASRDWDKHFIQTANIIFDDNTAVDWNGDGDVNHADAVGFSPIGNANVNFTGSFDGQGYRIKNLYINNRTSYTGLFGRVADAELRNISLYGVDISSMYYVGSLVGYVENNVIIESCFAKGSVDALGYAGGLVGYIVSDTQIEHSFSSVDVQGLYYVGGFVGMSVMASVEISNSFATGDVDAFVYSGGFVGANQYSEIENVYASGKVTADYYAGGVAGFSQSGIANSFWDVESSGLSTSSGGAGVVGKTSEEMQDETTFDNWDFDDDWSINEADNGGYPFLEIIEEAVLPVVTEFVGDGDWNEKDNWTNGVPDGDEEMDVVIDAKCKLDDEVSVNGIKITTKGSLVLGEAANISAKKEIVLESAEDGTAELYSPAAFADTVQQKKFFKGGQWNFICVPVEMKAGNLFPDMQLAKSFVDPDGEYWLVEYSQQKRDTTGTGMQDVISDDYILTPGMGYMVWVDNDVVGEYKHLVANSESRVDTKYTAKGKSPNHSGWNLVGNPFSHTMTYEDVFDCPHNQEYFTGAVYVWDGIGYKTWVGTTGDEEATTIAPMEAFFIKRTSSDKESEYFCMAPGECSCSVNSSKSVSLLEQDRSHNRLEISLNSKSNVNCDKTFICLNSNATEGFDDALDARKFETKNAYKDLIFSSFENDAFAVNAIALDSGVFEIPLTISLSAAMRSVSLAFDVMTEEGCQYYLLDKYDDDTTLLSDGDFFDYEVDDAVLIDDRFSVVVRNTPPLETAIDAPLFEQENLVELQFADGVINVRSIAEETVKGAVIDMSGKVVDTFVLEPCGEYVKNYLPGAYVVKLTSGGKLDQHKIVVE